MGLDTVQTKTISEERVLIVLLAIILNLRILICLLKI